MESVKKENIKINSLEDLEKIKTPEELLNFLKREMKYGFVKRSSREIVDNKKIDWDKNIQEEYFLQKPEDYLKTKHGVCFDSVEVERYWFSSRNIKFKTFLAIFVGRPLPTHTFLVYENNNKWFWFEYAWQVNQGIHEYGDLKQLLFDIKNKKLQGIEDQGISEEDLNSFAIYEYKDPVLGASINDFCSGIVNNNKPVDI